MPHMEDIRVQTTSTCNEANEPTHRVKVFSIATTPVLVLASASGPVMADAAKEALGQLHATASEAQSQMTKMGLLPAPAEPKPADLSPWTILSIDMAQGTSQAVPPKHTMSQNPRQAAMSANFGYPPTAELPAQNPMCRCIVQTDALTVGTEIHKAVETHAVLRQVAREAYGFDVQGIVPKTAIDPDKLDLETARAVLRKHADTIGDLRRRLNVKISELGQSAERKKQVIEHEAELIAARRACERMRLERDDLSASRQAMVQALAACDADFIRARTAAAALGTQLRDVRRDHAKLTADLETARKGLPAGQKVTDTIEKHPTRDQYRQRLEVYSHVDENGHRLQTEVRTDIAPPNTKVVWDRRGECSRLETIVAEGAARFDARPIEHASASAREEIAALTVPKFAVGDRVRVKSKGDRYSGMSGEVLSQQTDGRWWNVQLDGLTRELAFYGDTELEKV